MYIYIYIYKTWTKYYMSYERQQNRTHEQENLGELSSLKLERDSLTLLIVELLAQSNVVLLSYLHAHPTPIEGCPIRFERREERVREHNGQEPHIQPKKSIFLDHESKPYPLLREELDENSDPETPNSISLRSVAVYQKKKERERKERKGKEMFFTSIQLFPSERERAIYIYMFAYILIL